MDKNSRQIIVAKALEDLIKGAIVVLEEQLWGPIKARLLELPAAQRREGVIAAECVKAYIQEDRAKEEINQKAVANDLLAALKSGMYSSAEMAELLEAGAICLADAEKAAGSVAAKLGKDVGGYTHTQPGGGRPALKMLVTAKGRFEGLRARIAALTNLPAMLQDAVSQLETADLEEPAPGTTSIGVARRRRS